MANDDVDKLLEIPDFLKRKKDDNSKGVGFDVVSSVSLGNSADPSSTVESPQEALGRRRKRKNSRDVKTLKALGWTASQLNKIDHHKASEYAFTGKEPPKLYERKKSE